MRLKPLDALWLLLESAETPMHAGVLATFRLPARAPADYLRELARELRAGGEPVAPWNCRLAGFGGAGIAPRLVREHDFDLDYHFRHSALPEPGGERELGVVVSRLHSQTLDRNRPLWECHLIEGLEDRRFAVYLKVHLALVSNVNSIPLFLSALAGSARSRRVVPWWTLSRDQVPQGQNREWEGADLVGALARPGETLAGMRRMGGGFARDLFSGGGSYLLPWGTPRSTLNRRINAQRRFATQQFEQERIENLAAVADCSLDTILAYLCGSTLRRFFKEYNALPGKSLVAALPVSLGARGEGLPDNAVTGLRVALCTDIGDPLRRLEAVKDVVEAVRQDRESLPSAAVTPYVLLRSAPIYAGQLPALGRLVPPVYNLTVSNTPGPESRRYLRGARLEALYPVSPLMQYSALSVDCVGYAGTLNIGFTGARDTLPHLQRLAVYTGKAVDELERLLAAGEDGA